MEISKTISPADLRRPLTLLFELAARKTAALDKRWRTRDGAPVITTRGKYTTREWTQWTQGFQYGNALLAFDLVRHAVEGAAQRRQLVVALAFRNARRKIAGAHLLGGGREPADRDRELGSEIDADRDRRHQKQHRYH